MWGSSADDVYVLYATPRDVLNLSYDVRVRHFDGASWTDVPLPAQPSWVPQVWGSGPDDVYIAAGGPLYHVDGGRWGEVHQSAVNVTGTARDNVFALSAPMLEVL